jgi:hypothetical protein
MRKIIGLLSIVAILSSCDIDQKKEMKLPEVDVDIDAEAGQLPTFDVDWADVNVGMRTDTITVPKVVVVMEEVEVEIPYIDVDMPDDEDDAVKEEQTLMVEVEVEGNEHTIDIKDIWVRGDNLIVVSELEATNTSLGDQKLRVSDQVTLNAPEMNVRYYIVGEKPNRVFNNRYKYFKDMDALKAKVGNDYKSIYSR